VRRKTAGNYTRCGLKAEQLREEIAYARPKGGKVNNPAVCESYECHAKVLLPDASYTIPFIIAHSFCDFNSFLRLWKENFFSSFS